MATTICSRRATRTSANVRTTYVVGATVQNAVYTVPARSVLVPYTTSTCTTRLASRLCSSYVTSRYSISPGEQTFSKNQFKAQHLFSAHLLTTPVTLHVQRTSYITSYTTLYSTSCTVSRRPTTPTPTPQPKPITTYVTVGTTTTRTSILYPSQSTVGPNSDSDIVDPPPTDTPITADGRVISGPKKLPIGAIVGGVLGGLVVAFLIGFLVYMLV